MVGRIVARGPPSPGCSSVVRDLRLVGRLAGVLFVYPEATVIGDGGPVASEQLESVNEAEIRRMVRRPNNYPCGGQNECHTYPAKYIKAVAPVLADVLLGRELVSESSAG